jgi:hypothetical protein
MGMFTNGTGEGGRLFGSEQTPRSAAVRAPMLATGGEVSLF